MINVKDQIYQKLQGICDNVSDIYPQATSTFPAIQYTEEANNVYMKTDKEELSMLRYRIDIWNTGSTSQLALAVDEAISELGLVRTQCMDVADPRGLRQKQMRYEGIIDVGSQMVYWEGSR